MLWIIIISLKIFLAASDQEANSTTPPYKDVIIEARASNFREYLEQIDPITLLNMERMVMGERTPCDNGRMKIKIDFDPFDEELSYLYECPRKREIAVDEEVQPFAILYDPPRGYRPLHRCMDSSIEYIERIPTIGPHRPLWAVWGEYTYLPVQRWLHNIEHGAIILLYHPCVDQTELNKLRKLVKQCIYRHIITPYPQLTKERPLALATWAASLEMNKVDLALAKHFIQEYALKGPERTSKNGQYQLMLVEKARIVSDVADTVLCPEKIQPTFFTMD